MRNLSKTVFVGLSGGVDSSVAALRLKNKGYTVVGVFIKVWHPDFLACNWEAERLDAMRVAAHLDIPFLTCDAEKTYKREVADYFISEYSAGRTPNPDVMCNASVKFGAFYRFALENGADFVATGHYARIETHNGVYLLHRGVDEGKDQSYFLWTLTQKQLAHILFPIGRTKKDTVRKEARQSHIPVAQKKDSQGICFLGHIDIPDFLSHYINLKEGDVLNAEGTVIGTHQGAFVYTVGQRHGFTITSSSNERHPHYVVERDIEQNTITVGTDKPIAEKDTQLTLTRMNWIREMVQKGTECLIQTRYRQNPVRARVDSLSEDSITMSILEKHEYPAKGQSCVLYDRDVCLGGGIIS